MWFVFLAAGLVLVTVGGIYANRRLAAALESLGVRPRRIQVVRWTLRWLLFGFPLLVIGSIVVALALGHETLPRFDGVLAAWLLAFPFAWAILVVLQALPWLLALDVAQRLLHRPRLRTIGVLVVMGVFVIYTPLHIFGDRSELRVRHYQLGAATPTPPFRIAFVSDVHQDAVTGPARIHPIFEQLNADQPDIVLAGGDWISTGPSYIEAAAASAGMLKSRLGTYSVRGDHEHFAYVDRQRSVAAIEKAMRDHGVAMLADEVRWFDHQGKRIAVVFLDYNYIHHSDPVTIATLVASVQTADYSIVVTHQLDTRLALLLADKVDLVLAGHTHGGQMNPVVGLTHQNLARLETPYVDGRYQLGRTTAIVTAGIGYSIVPFRYAAPSSVERIDVVPARD